MFKGEADTVCKIGGLGAMGNLPSGGVVAWVRLSNIILNGWSSWWGLVAFPSPISCSYLGAGNDEWGFERGTSGPRIVT